MKVLLVLLGFVFPCLAVKLPSGISKHQYCEGCISTMKELSKKLTRKTESQELLVMDSMERVCNPQNFVSYEYSPPRTVKACKLLLERHEEEIEHFLINDGRDAEKKVCYDISSACTGVNRDEKPKDLGDIDLTNNSEGKDKFSKVVDIDPATGKAKIRDEESSSAVDEDQNSSTKELNPKRRGAGKTLSKKDKKKKGEKNGKSGKKKEEAAKKVEKKSEESNKKGSFDYLNVDINDPNSIKNVLEQINKIKKDHEDNFHKVKKAEGQQKDEL